MTRDDIIKMAREAGAMFDHMTWVERDLAPVFERFAELVAAAEREACAKVCEILEAEDDSFYAEFSRAKDCATAIRARGDNE
jgi:hypothetical protein